jgi:hypothetical protein
MTPRAPELAGLATYREAARIGYPVDENVRRLLRYHWIELRLMDALIARLPSTPEWEVKCAMALHQWQHGEHADLLRRRISEMRHPLPPLDSPPDAALDRALDESLGSEDTVELLAAVYGVFVPALYEAYREHLRETNPLVDHPTTRILRTILLDEDDTLAWAEQAVEAITAHDPDTAERTRHRIVQANLALSRAGGIAGTGTVADDTVPGSPFPAPDLAPRRDARFSGLRDFDFPPHVIYNDPRVAADERNLALLCKRTLEMDVPEMMASILVERRDLPWPLRLSLSRQLWDEARHAMMGTVAFESRGIDWTKIPLNIGFALRLNRHASALERQIMLWAIEQSLMPADTGKRFEQKTAADAGDALSAHFHDYDWADEVLHTQIGRRVLKHDGITPDEANARAQEIHERTWAALDQYRGPVEHAGWWNAFVRQALGKESALTPEEYAALSVIAE